MKKNEESKFMQLWHNKRTHAAMVLGLWMIFLLFVMIIAFIGGEATQTTPLPSGNNNQKEDIVFKDYNLMQQNLLISDFNYEYSITSGDYKVKYIGSKKDGVDTGYRETTLETIKYQIDETGLYKVLMGELYVYDKLYENVNESIISLENIFEVINKQSVSKEVISETQEFVYNFLENDINYNIKIITNKENIAEINIKFDNNEYILKYDLNIEEVN